MGISRSLAHHVPDVGSQTCVRTRNTTAGARPALRMSRPGETILVFSRIPHPGQTKTRLIPKLGAWRAAKLHERLLVRTLAIARMSGARVELHWAGRGRGHLQKMKKLLAGHGVRVVPQLGDDLGLRMLHAIRLGLRRGGRVILVGSDIPALSRRDFGAALGALRAGYHCAISPTEDGGYALLALRRVVPELFHGFRWSQPDVYACTSTVLDSLQLRWKALSVLWDVDTPTDARRALDVRSRRFFSVVRRSAAR